MFRCGSVFTMLPRYLLSLLLTYFVYAVVSSPDRQSLSARLQLQISARSCCWALPASPRTTLETSPRKWLPTRYATDPSARISYQACHLCKKTNLWPLPAITSFSIRNLCGLCGRSSGSGRRQIPTLDLIMACLGGLSCRREDVC